LTAELASELDQALGALPMLRRRREEARAAAGARGGKSRLRDLVELAARQPIFTTPMVLEALAVSPRASRMLVDQAAQAGILRLITPRASRRVWVRPDIAAQLAMRRGPTQVGGRRGGRSAEQGDEGARTPAIIAPPGGIPEDPEAAVTREAATLDAALAMAGAVLARYAGKGWRLRAACPGRTSTIARTCSTPRTGLTSRKGALCQGGDKTAFSLMVGKAQI
jgi:hypothetical protein